MNTLEEIPTSINSAYAMHKYCMAQEAKQRSEAEKVAREHATVESLKRMVTELTRQNEFLRAEAKRDAKWKWIATIIAIIGAVGSILGIIF